MDDKYAIKRLISGDIQGLDPLIERYQIRALRTAYLIIQDKGLAEDVVQDAFITVYHSIHTFDSNRPFQPWFMRIVINSAVKTSKSRETYLSFDQSTDMTPPDFSEGWSTSEPEPDEVVISGETKDALWSALERLPAEHRAVIVLKFFLELSEAEIAEQLDIPLGTVKSRIFYAKVKLQNMLLGQKERGDI